MAGWRAAARRWRLGEASSSAYRPVLLATMLAASLGSEAAASGISPARVARGQYLVNLCECFVCHSPLEKTRYETPVKHRLGAGDIINAKQRKVAPNLTPDRATGAGSWSDAQLVRAIRKGISHDGRQLSLAMPYDYFSVMTDDDVASVVAYLRSLPAVRNTLPKWIPTDVAETPPEALRSPLTPAEIQRPVDRGAYLVRLARCGLCHTARPAGVSWRHRRLDMEFGGGRRFSATPFYDELDPDPATTAAPKAGRGGGAGIVVSANITPDPSGIAFFDEAIFIETIRTGRVAGIRPLSGAMPWNRFRLLTDEDLSAIFSYLRSVPPVRHRVNNTDPPTWCPRCGRFHGLGELNSP
jgi:mono/diheme cytochrome c family protein